MEKVECFARKVCESYDVKDLVDIILEISEIINNIPVNSSNSYEYVELNNYHEIMFSARDKIKNIKNI